MESTTSVGGAFELEQVGHEADAQAGDVGGARRPRPARRGVVLDGGVGARRVHGVLAGDRLERERDVVDALAERPDLVERAAERDDAVARDAPVGGLERHGAGERAGLADRAAGVAARATPRPRRR